MDNIKQVETKYENISKNRNEIDTMEGVNIRLLSKEALIGILITLCKEIEMMR